MRILLEKFVGQECEVSCCKVKYKGKLVEMTDSAVMIDNGLNIIVVNIAFITSIIKKKN